MLPAFLAERQVIAEGAATASNSTMARAASLPAPHSPPDSAIIRTPAKLGDAVPMSLPSPSLGVSLIRIST